MVLSPIFSARTTNPEGRNGRRPVTVRIIRSSETNTLGRISRGTGEDTDMRRGPQAVAAAVPAARADTRRNLRRFKVARASWPVPQPRPPATAGGSDKIKKHGP